MTFKPKEWKNSPNRTTPVSAAALIDLEERVTGAPETALNEKFTGNTLKEASLPSSVILNTVVSKGGDGGGGTDNNVVGSGACPNPVAETTTALVASSAIVSPNKPFLGALAGYARFTGTPGEKAGTLQGGSCESSVALESNVTQGILGFEMIGSAVAGTAHTAPLVVGGQGTAFVENSVTLAEIVALRARGPFSNAGAPTVTNAKSLDVQEPTTGTNRWAIYAVGKTTLQSDTVRSPLEIRGASKVLQWAVSANAGKLTGYASDGASERVVLDTTDSAATRLSLTASGNMKGLVLNAIGPEANLLELQVGGTPKFAIVSSGELYVTGTAGTTSPAAGGAGALPATPKGYLTLTINGTARQVAYY